LSTWQDQLQQARMFRHFLHLILPIIAVLGLLSGCSSAPVQEMSDARQAITAARQVEAVQYAPDLMQRAIQQLAVAEQALEAGAWKSARTSAMAAREDAIAARLQVEQQRSRN
jgi:PBP1b-binding outer membrane lipoprotein LpoB